MLFSEKLQQLRRSRGFSQEQLAARLAVSRQAVSKWETGEALPGTEYLLPLSRALAVTLDFLLDDSQDTPFPAEQEAAAVPASHKPPLPSRLRLMVGLAMAGAGGLGLLLIWVLSTMQLAQFQRPYSYYDAAGVLWYTSETVWDYSFLGYIEYHRLYAVVAIAAILLCAGTMLLYRWHQKHGAKRQSAAQKSDSPLPPTQ